MIYSNLEGPTRYHHTSFQHIGFFNYFPHIYLIYLVCAWGGHGYPSTNAGVKGLLTIVSSHHVGPVK